MKMNKTDLNRHIDMIKKEVDEYRHIESMRKPQYSYDDFDSCVRENTERQNQDKQLIATLMRNISFVIEAFEVCQEENKKLERKLSKKKEQYRGLKAYTKELEEKYGELSYDFDKKERKHKKQVEKLNGKLQKKTQKINRQTKVISSSKKTRKKLKNMLRSERYENGKNPYDFARQGRSRRKDIPYLPQQHTSSQRQDIIDADMTKYSEKEVYR